jgi:flagella basal body P-ring formation protein FlgA
MTLLRILFALTLAVAAAAAEPDALVERLQQEALASAESASAALAGTRVFRVVRPPVLPQVRSGALSFEFSHLSKQDATGFFFASFKVLVDGRPAGTARVDLEGRWTGVVLKARSVLPRHAVPTTEDLEAVDFVGTPPPGALQSIPEGYRLRIPVIAGHVITRNDLQPIPVIKAGDPVRVRMVCGSLSVSLEATARSSAAEGEKVRLELPNGRKSLQALATGPGEALVEWKL